MLFNLLVVFEGGVVYCLFCYLWWFDCVNVVGCLGWVGFVCLGVVWFVLACVYG